MSNDINFTLNTTSLQSFLFTLNEASGGWFMNAIPITIFLVVMIAFLRFEQTPRDAILYANIVGLIVSILLRAMNLLSDVVLMMFVAGIIINILLLIKDQ